jgi:hypothetical protein
VSTDLVSAKIMAPFLKKWRKARRQRKKYFKRLTSITQFAPEDIFIVGYPKSGNTWFQDLITAVVYGVHPAFAPPALAQLLVPDVHKQPYYRRFSFISYGMAVTSWFPFTIMRKRWVAR